MVSRRNASLVAGCASLVAGSASMVAGGALTALWLGPSLCFAPVGLPVPRAQGRRARRGAGGDSGKPPEVHQIGFAPRSFNTM